MYFLFIYFDHCILRTQENIFVKQHTLLCWSYCKTFSKPR